nr:MULTISPECIES: hypothetical protein [Pseudomonas]
MQTSNPFNASTKKTGMKPVFYFNAQFRRFIAVQCTRAVHLKNPANHPASPNISRKPLIYMNIYINSKVGIVSALSKAFPVSGTLVQAGRGIPSFIPPGG